MTVENREGRDMRLRFWLSILDAVAFLGGFGGRLYLWVIERAASEEYK